VLRRGTRHVENRAATAFRMAATSLWRSKIYLGAKFRRLPARLGAPKGITAMAHMLARLVYRMLRYGEQYVDKGMKYYEEKYREHEIRSISEKSQGPRPRGYSLHRRIRDVSEEFPCCRNTPRIVASAALLNGDSVLVHVRTSSYCPVAFQEAAGMPT
jgi:hypothetical protein